jgi:hypothetical protein
VFISFSKMVKSSSLSSFKITNKNYFSIFASNLSNCGRAFFNVDEAPSFETKPLHLEDLQYGYLG